MSVRMPKDERKRFDNKILDDYADGWNFEVWEEKHHTCCVVVVVRKGPYVAREHRFPTEMITGLMANWKKGIHWLEKERRK